MYSRHIPRYSCAHGVWMPDFGDSKSFTRKDVKAISKDTKKMCVIIRLKDGTKINPEFVTASNEDILNMWYNKWILDVLHLKSALPLNTKNHRSKYRVYDLRGNFIAETTAVSEAKAVNNVRHNWDGDIPTNDDFFAVKIGQDGNEFEKDSLYWYAVEFSIAGNDESEFNQAHALYETVKADSKKDAKQMIEYEYFKYTNDKCVFANVYFGCVKEFSFKQDALACAREWQLKKIIKEDL